jgi:LacI family transcriptional regulator
MMLLRCGRQALGIRRLARELDLSITTVSRALAGYPDVSKATQDRVRAAARASGYRPNASARSLKLGKSNTVGLIVPASRGDAFLSELVAGMSLALAERDLDLVVTSTAPGASAEAAIKRVHDARKVDGFVIPRTLWDDPRIDALLELDAPFVTHGRTARMQEHAWLDIDGVSAFREAGHRLLELGHRRIGFINAPQRFTYARHRLSGFTEALRGAGLEANDGLTVHAEAASIAEGERLAKTLLDLKPQPTALLCATDQLAVGALAAIRAAGLRAGEDISVIGYDDVTLAAHTVPPLTTMRQPTADEGRELVRLLMGRIEGKPVEELQTLWTAELVVRASDGPCKAR